jgi:hypothetical protein
MTRAYRCVIDWHILNGSKVCQTRATYVVAKRFLGGVVINQKLFTPLVRENYDVDADEEGPVLCTWTESLDTAPYIWAVANGYEVVDGQIKISKVGAHTRYDPLGGSLESSKLFNSFIKLRGSERRPSSDRGLQKRILEWVHKYGLLKRQETYETPALFLREETNQKDEWDRGKEPFVNQAPVSLEEFKEHVREARSAADLYLYFYRKDVAGLARWRDTLDEAERKDGDLDEVERCVLLQLTPLGNTLSDNSIAMLAIWFDVFLSKKLSDVEVSMSTSWYFIKGEKYAPRRKYSYHDLISAIWLQFYLAITQGNEPRICRNSNCQAPFFPERADHVTCSDGCRSSSRPSRKKPTS